MRCAAVPPSGVAEALADKMGRSKATWGSRVLSRAARARRLLVAGIVLILITSLPAAAAPGHGAEIRAKDNNSKLDAKLEELAQNANGESDVIIEFTDDRDALTIVKQFGTPGRQLGILKGYTATIPNHLLERLSALGSIKKVSLDREVSVLNGRTAIATGARAVQELSGYTGAGIGVAVVDSGVVGFHDDLTHEQTTVTATGQWFGDVALSGATVTTTTFWGQRVVHFADFVNGATTPYDDFGHGSHVAGTIAGNGYASGGQRKAIAPGANIVALKALDGTGRGKISNIIAAIDYAVAVKSLYNIRVINLSLGAGVYESYHTDPLTLAARRAVEAGIVVVAAAGNLGKAKDGTPQYGAITAPANAPWVLTIGASSTEGTTDRVDDVMALYSSRGPTMIDHAAKPDLVAPGTGTVSVSAPDSLLYSTKPHLLLSGADPLLLPYMSLTGTSMSAPVVAGTVALMLEANPKLTPNLVKAILQFTSQVYPGYNWLTQGAGFLNTRGAVQLAAYFAAATKGSPYPDKSGWSKHIFWGNYRVTGGVLTPGGTAWSGNVTWGVMQTPAGQNVVWGESCSASDPNCDNVVWGNNLVWGNSDPNDNVVWGNGAVDNVVWGNSNGDNVVWGNNALDNVVWGNCTGDTCDNVVWGNSDGDNVVWGNNSDSIVFGDDGADMKSFDPAIWDDLFKATALTTSAGSR
jgi:serine protease AprX